MRTNTSGGRCCLEYTWSFAPRSSCGSGPTATHRSTPRPRCRARPSRDGAPRRSKRCAWPAWSTCELGSIRIAAARSGRNPKSTSSTRRKLRISNPAPTRSTQANAISETTSVERIQCVVLPVARAAVGVLQGIINGAGGNPERGDKPEDEAGEKSHSQSETERVQVEKNASPAAEARGLQIEPADVFPPRRDPDRARRRSPTGRRSRSASAEPGGRGRRPGRHGSPFPSASPPRGPTAGSRGGAHDQHHDANRAGEHKEGGAKAPAHVLVERAQREPQLVALVPHPDGLAQRAELGLGLLNGDPGFQTPDQRQGIPHPVHVRRERKRKEQIDPAAWREHRAEIEGRRQDADHRVWPIVQRERPADDGGIGCRSAASRSRRSRRRRAGSPGTLPR